MINFPPADWAGRGGTRVRALLLLGVLALSLPVAALQPGDVLLIANRTSPTSRSIAEYYARQRGLAPAQILYLECTPDEEIPRDVYRRDIAAPVARYLRQKGWVEKVLVLVTTLGVPLKIRGTLGQGAEAASVDSELTLLYSELHGAPPAAPAGSVPNPYYNAREAFRHPKYPLYLVTRLAGYTFADVRAAIDRAGRARNTGVVVLDQKGMDLNDGNFWLKQAANRLPPGRVLLEDTSAVVRHARSVIGYASWGSNDDNHTMRDPGFEFLPGALVTEFVSTDGRTFFEPPAAWQTGSWKEPLHFHGGSPQSLSADYLRQGATGVSGHVYEPFLHLTPHPEVLFPAYLQGLTLAESFWSAIPSLSWMNIVVGDPLCRLRP